ncbi:hypothetical protein E2320_018778 [Naja naja]|nr:hypothetical protein E2320_018778 [Naja naja]
MEENFTVKEIKDIVKEIPALISPREMNQPDPVEEALRTQIEQKKISYKTMFTHLKGLKIEIEHLQLLMEKAKLKLQKDFEAWWSEETINLESQEEKPLLQNSASVLKTPPLFFENQLYPGTIRVPNNSRASSNEESTVKSSVSRLSNSNSEMRYPVVTPFENLEYSLKLPLSQENRG